MTTYYPFMADEGRGNEKSRLDAIFFQCGQNKGLGIFISPVDGKGKVVWARLFLTLHKGERLFQANYRISLGYQVILVAFLGFLG